MYGVLVLFTPLFWSTPLVTEMFFTKKWTALGDSVHGNQINARKSLFKDSDFITRAGSSPAEFICTKNESKSPTKPQNSVLLSTYHDSLPSLTLGASCLFDLFQVLQNLMIKVVESADPYFIFAYPTLNLSIFALAICNYQFPLHLLLSSACKWCDIECYSSESRLQSPYRVNKIYPMLNL